MIPEAAPALTDENCRRIAEWIIENFKLHYLNDKGLISRTYPVSDRTIFDNFDDLAPFFLYYGEIEFLLDQIERFGDSPFDELLPFNNLIYSYYIDEYLGGMHALYRRTNSPKAKSLLDDAVAKCLDYFIADNALSEFYDYKAGKPSPYTSPWSSGLLETFLEMRDIYPQLQDIVVRIVDRWLNNRFYLREGLFPFRSSNHPFYFLLGQANAGRKAYRKDCPFTSAEKSGSLLNRAKYQASKSLYLYANSGHYIQLMKSNSTMVFTLIELFRLTGNRRYSEHVTNWISACFSKLVKDGVVFGNYYLDGSVGSPGLVNAFILMDVLADTYWFIDRDQKYLDWATGIAEKQMANQWRIGLLPICEGSNLDHLDHQVDFAVSLRRLGELTGKSGYIQSSRSLLENTLRLHRIENGFCTHIDSTGHPVCMPVNTVDPKYNALLLKGLILLSESELSIYGNESFRELLKDR